MIEMYKPGNCMVLPSEVCISKDPKICTFIYTVSYKLYPKIQRYTLPALPRAVIQYNMTGNKDQTNAVRLIYTFVRMYTTAVALIYTNVLLSDNEEWLYSCQTRLNGGST